MQIASELAGFSMGEADVLRRAMGKKDREMMAKQRESFVSRAKARGVPEKKAEKIFDIMAPFAEYAFNKCLAADTLIEMADGAQKPITEVRAGDLVLTKDGPFRALGIRPSGTRRVGRLVLANGMAVRCTPDHPIFTQRGWVNAEELTADDFVAVARELPCGTQAVRHHLPALLGYALSEGSLGYERHFYLYSTDPDEIEDMARILSAFANTLPRVEARPDKTARSVRPVRIDPKTSSEAVEFLFRECGLQGKTALDKRVPPGVDQWNRDAIVVLVGKLFQGDGCIHAKTRSIFYATSSEGLARDVRRLLLKLGLPSTIHRKTFAYRGGRRVGYTVNLIGGRSAYSLFQDLVGPHLVGKRRRALATLVASYTGMRTLLARGTVNVLPLALCQEPLREAIRKRYPSLKAGCRALGVAYRLLFPDRGKRGIRRDTLECLAERLDTPALQALAAAPIGWSRPKSFTVEGIEPTYDFEVPGAKSFIANGIVVHNSHAASYAIVAYQTAYLKANFPVEFMAALLTSEMGNTDKIVRHIEECRAMGLEVLPPDVNLSRTQFTVSGTTIRFGLAAIKNVGEKAIESILATRTAKGPFTSIEDFCRRVDTQLVNRRVSESLIKAGAFDSLGAPRAQLLAALDQAMEAGQRYQRERQQGQGSFFDMLGGEPPSVAREVLPAELPEWEADQLLAYEKEVLGFYLTGHPLARYQPYAARLGAVGVGGLAGRDDGSRVTLLGLVSSLKEITTKGGGRMAFVTLEDMSGSIEVTVFPETYKATAAHLRGGLPLLVRGRLEGGDEKKLLAEEIQPVTEAPGPPADGPTDAPFTVCRIRVQGPGTPRERLETLLELCRAHAGPFVLYLHVALPPRGEVVVRARGVTVGYSPRLVEEVEGLLGRSSISFE